MQPVTKRKPRKKDGVGLGLVVIGLKNMVFLGKRMKMEQLEETMEKVILLLM